MEVLELKLAVAGAESEKWSPDGKVGLKAAILASLSSDDIISTMLMFCYMYFGAGKPEGAYACYIETALVGANKFGPGSDLDTERPVEYGCQARKDAAMAISKIFIRSKNWKSIWPALNYVMAREKPADLLKTLVYDQNISWDEKDAEDALRVALANPVLK